MARQGAGGSRASVRFELRSAGIAEILRSPAVDAMLRQKAEAVAAAARGKTRIPVKVDARPSASRARYTVTLASKRGRAEEARTRALGSSIDAARG